MMFTALALAAALMGAAPSAAVVQTPAPPAQTPTTNDTPAAAPAPGSPEEVVCQRRAPIGSRFVSDRCETRRQRAAARAAAQRYMQDTGPGPSTDAVVSGPSPSPN